MSMFFGNKFIMRLIGVIFLLILVACSSSPKPELGDVYALHVNSADDYESYRRKTNSLERDIGMEKLPSHNQNGLHVFYYLPASVNVYYYFIPEMKTDSSFYVNNIQGFNACGKMFFDEKKQAKIFDYEVENFPFLNIYRDGKFPLKGNVKESYNRCYRL